MPKGQKHHYIPEFYLKQWAGADGRLCEYSRQHKEVKPHRRHPSETGFERGLYTLTTYPEPTADIVERKLMKSTDDYASRALRLLLDDNTKELDAKTRSGWARFIISLMRRSPEAVKDLSEKIRTTFLEVTLSLALPGDPDEDLQERAMRSRVERGHALLLQDLINSEMIGTRLINMLWFVVNFKDVPHSLLTSDRPFVMTNGIGHNNSHLAIPISPTKLFLAAATPEEEKRLRTILPEHLVLQMNDRMALQARRFVYGVDDKQLRFVANRLGRQAKAGPADV